MISLGSILENQWVQKSFLIFHICTALYIGFLLGTISEQSTAYTPLPPTITSSDTHQYIPTLTILGLHENVLYAQLDNAPLRITTDENIYEPTLQSPFGIFIDYLPEAVKNTSTIYDDPCILMASPTGKYVYLKNDPKTNNLKEPLCFSSLSDALHAGYQLKD